MALRFPKSYRVLKDQRQKRADREKALRQMRAACKARAKGLCEIGLDHPGAETHHIVPRSLGGSDTADNGAFVCHLHHQELTHHLIEILSRTKAGTLRWERRN